MDQVEGVGWNLKFDPRFRAIRKATLSIKTSFENVSFRVSERGSHRSRRNRASSFPARFPDCSELSKRSFQPIRTLHVALYRAY